MKGILASAGIFGVVMASIVMTLEVCVALLFSQVQIPESLDGITSITSIGFAIWYGWYVTTKAVPKIIDQHGEQIAKLEAAHTKQIDSLGTTFREELRGTRERCYSVQQIAPRREDH